MSKRAKQAALKAYPPTYTTVKRHAKRVQSELVDTHKPVRAIFQQGYEMAEKDLALTWKDVKKIVTIADSMLTYTAWDAVDWPDKQKYYEEVLRRFNAKRNEKEI